MGQTWWLLSWLFADDLGELTRYHILYDGIISVVLFCLITFSMRVLIKAELKINPNPVDGFKFRLRATRAVILAFFIWAGYRTCKLFLIIAISGAGDQSLQGFHYGILLSLIVGIPAIFYNLLNYQKPE